MPKARTLKKPAVKPAKKSKLVAALADDYSDIGTFTVAESLAAESKSAATESAVDADHRVRLLRKEVESLKRQLREQETGNQLIVQAIQDVWQEPAEVRLQKLPKPGGPCGGGGRCSPADSEIAVLHLSDIHVGKRTATYDSAVAAERVALLTAKTLEITALRRSRARIDECRIYLGGDMIEGEQIFPHQAHEIDASLLEQAVKRAPEIVADVVLSLANVFSRVKVVAVPGNHGRNGPKHTSSNPATNWDSVCYEVARRIVTSAARGSLAKDTGSGKDTGSDKDRITWDLPGDRAEEWYALDRVAGWGCLLVHGHQIKGMLGMPWYGFGKKVAGWVDTMPEGFDYVFTGHFHTAAAFDINHRTVLASGSTESSNVYARENLAAAGYPKQRLCFFNSGYGMLVDQPLYLSDDRRPNR